MSETAKSDDVEKGKKALAALKADWARQVTKIDGLSKDDWHRIKGEDKVKKTKWFQSGSSIGPKIDKVKADGKAFSTKWSTSSYLSLLSSLEALKKDADDFWKKHKDSVNKETGQVEAKKVEAALKDYSRIAGEVHDALRAHAAQIKMIDAYVGSQVIAKVTSLGGG